jgi:hypothetical protein
MATISTVGSGKDYSTLQLWEDWADGQASAAQWAECYSGGTLGAVTIAGWTGTPSAVNYPKIYAAEGHRHDGTASLTNGAYCGTITLQEEYSQVDGMRVIQTGNTGINGARWVHKISNCVVCVTVGAVAYTALYFAYSWTGTRTLEFDVENCLIYHISGTQSGTGIGFYPSTTSGTLTVNVNVLNCTIYNTRTTGIWWAGNESVAGSITFNITSTNNAVIGSGSNDYLASAAQGTVTHNVTQTYCVSSDATADDWGGAGNVISQSAAACFGDPGVDNAPLAAGPISAGNGADLSGIFTTDALGVDRGSSWSIGALQEDYVPSAFPYSFGVIIG